MRKTKSLLINGIYNVIKTFSSLVFPVITFAYASRKLGETGIGKVSFVKSIISYFVMLAMLGMNYYGTREAAKLRDDRALLGKFTQEMLVINGCTTLLSCAFAFLCFVLIPRLKGYGMIFLVSALAIPLQGLGMEWLYQALEEYRYIAIRSVIFQVIAFVLMLVIVRVSDDVVPYAIVSLIAGSGAYILNFLNARKYVSVRWRGKHEIKKHIMPLLWLFALAVSIELYTVLDSTMLGFLKGDAAVGRYTAAVKVNRMANSLIASITVVLIPRLSSYIGRGEMKRVKSLVERAYNYTFLLSIPAAVGLFMLSDEIVILLSGKAFATAGTTMRIMTPIVVLIPFSMATNQQTFVPMKKEKLILISTLAGAVTNFICNTLLIPRYAENGAAWGTVMAECVVALVCLRNAARFFDIKATFKNYHQYWLAAMTIPAVCWIVSYTHFGVVITVTLKVCLSAAGYFCVLRLLKNPYLLSAVASAKGKLFRALG